MSTPNLLDLKVPSVGESVSEVEVGDWLKPEGATVARDESLVILETDKATMEVPAPVAGRLSRILKQKGERVAVGDVLGQLEPDAKGASAPAEAPPPEAAPAEPAATVKATDPARVMPAAARLLAERKIDLDKVEPSGPGGRVLKEDVSRASKSAAVLERTGGGAGGGRRVAGIGQRDRGVGCGAGFGGSGAHEPAAAQDRGTVGSSPADGRVAHHVQ